MLSPQHQPRGPRASSGVPPFAPGRAHTELSDTKARNGGEANRACPGPLGWTWPSVARTIPSLPHLSLTRGQCTGHLPSGGWTESMAPGVCGATVVIKTPGQGWDAEEGQTPKGPAVGQVCGTLRPHRSCSKAHSSLHARCSRGTSEVQGAEEAGCGLALIEHPEQGQVKQQPARARPRPGDLSPGQSQHHPHTEALGLC